MGPHKPAAGLTHDAECAAEFRRILDRIIDGTTRARGELLREDVDTAIDSFARICDERRATYLRIVADTSFGLTTDADAATRLAGLLDGEAEPDQTTIVILTLLAKLTLHSTSWDQQCSIRGKAADIAAQLELWTELCVVLNNWLFAAVARDDMVRAEALVNRIESTVAAHSLFREEAHDDRLKECLSRFLTHKGQVAYRSAATTAEDRDTALHWIRTGDELYRQAIHRDRFDEHRRVNEQLEWASELVSAYKLLGGDLLDQAEAVLQEASYALNAHNCERCPGFFHFVRGRCHLARGDNIADHDHRRARQHWDAGRKAADQSLAFYRHVGYGGTHELEVLVETTRNRLLEVDKPRKVFLSHKGVDKDMLGDDALAFCLSTF